MHLSFNGWRRWAWLACLAGAMTGAQAHLMVAQKGTLNLQGAGAYLVVSLPVSAFVGIDDDGDGAWSAQELGLHGPQIHTQITAALLLRDEQGVRPVDGITLVPTPTDDKPDDPVTQLVVLARYTLANPVLADAPQTVQGLRFQAGLFGHTAAEQQLSIAVTQGAHRQLLVLTPERPEQGLFPGGGRVLLDYLALGVTHILTGWDHLLFLAVVLLGGGSWRQILGILSAFTAGHALTLAWGLLGHLPFGTSGVEPAIALTIVGMAAVESWQRRRSRVMALPWRLAAVFGCALVHGLGLASSLERVGLDSTHRLWSLLGFNLGVELAQCALAVGLGGLATWGMARSTSLQQAQMRQWGLAMAMALGVFWFIERWV